MSWSVRSSKRRSTSNRVVAAKEMAVDDLESDGKGNEEGYNPFLRSLLQFEGRRTKSLEREGRFQINYPKSNEGWITTLLVVQGRALNWMAFPWCLSVGHAAVFTIVQETTDYSYTHQPEDFNSWEVFFSFVLNSTLAFLLVFRLNRAASRFWFARQYWGDIVAQSRSYVSGLIAHGRHDLLHRDEAIRWMAAFCIVTMEHLRSGATLISVDNFAGILTRQQALHLETLSHAPMYAADKARYHLKQLFLVDSSTPPGLAIAWTQQLDTLENQLNTMIWSGGGMERIKSTPLPMVYVSHLRTFILINLLLFPWVFGPSWGWSTIPIVAVSAFAWLGIEGAAVEVEAPFEKERVNALNMDSFVLGLLATLQQQVKNDADSERSQVWSERA